MPDQIYAPAEAGLQLPSALARAVSSQLAGAGKHLKLPVGFGLADAAVLYTIPALPAGAVGMCLSRLYWEVTTSFTGGSASAIGVSSVNTSYATKGDLLGGAAGDVAATLVSTGLKYKGGTIGAKFGTNGVIVLVAGDVIRFDRVTSAFTAGAGFVHIAFDFLD